MRAPEDGNRSAYDRAKRYGRIAAAALVPAANWAADRAAKLLALRYLKGRPPIEFLDRLLILGYAENNGAFLGMGGDWPPAVKIAILVILPLVACISGVVYALRPSVRPSVTLCIFTIVGGGLGNLADRILYDFRVIDFMNFGIGPFRTGVLNVADISVTFGAIALVLVENYRPSNARFASS